VQEQLTQHKQRQSKLLGRRHSLFVIHPFIPQQEGKQEVHLQRQQQVQEMTLVTWG
jgi:hypothetical protein